MLCVHVCVYVCVCMCVCFKFGMCKLLYTSLIQAFSLLQKTILSSSSTQVYFMTSPSKEERILTAVCELKVQEITGHSWHRWMAVYSAVGIICIQSCGIIYTVLWFNMYSPMYTVLWFNMYSPMYTVLWYNI